MKIGCLNVPLYFIFLCCAFLQSISAEFHVVTVASRSDEGLDRLIVSCNEFGIPLRVLGMGLPYKNNAQKLTYMHEYINHLPNDDIVLFVDAFDVFFLSDTETILSKFYEMSSPIVVAAEIKCSALSEELRRTRVYPSSPTRFRYVNSGTYIGYVGALRSVFEAVGPWRSRLGAHGYFSDQAFLHEYFLNHLNEIRLDYNCELFFPLPGLSEESVVKLFPGEKKVLLLETNSKPLIVHGAGSGRHLYLVLFKKLFNSLY